MAAHTASERTVIRSIVARHIHSVLAAEQALNGGTGGLTFDALYEVRGAANTARGLQDALAAAGIDLTAELDRAALTVQES